MTFSYLKLSRIFDSVVLGIFSFLFSAQSFGGDMHVVASAGGVRVEGCTKEALGDFQTIFLV